MYSEGGAPVETLVVELPVTGVIEEAPELPEGVVPVPDEAGMVEERFKAVAGSDMLSRS